MILVCVVANLLILLFTSVHLADRNHQLLSSIMGQMGDRLSTTDRELLTAIISKYRVVTDIIFLAASGLSLVAISRLLLQRDKETSDPPDRAETRMGSD